MLLLLLLASLRRCWASYISRSSSCEYLDDGAGMRGLRGKLLCDCDPSAQISLDISKGTRAELEGSWFDCTGGFLSASRGGNPNGFGGLMSLLFACVVPSKLQGAAQASFTFPMTDRIGSVTYDFPLPQVAPA